MSLLREIVLDTETTGLSAANGDRLVEIGCVELINHVPTATCPTRRFGCTGCPKTFCATSPNLPK